jgi:hypothetical protein
MNDTANARLEAAVVAKLHVEGLTLASPWADIEACLAQVVGKTACIRAAKTLREREA